MKTPVRIAVGAMLAVTASIAHAQADSSRLPVGVMAQPCPPPLPVPAEFALLQARQIDPRLGAIDYGIFSTPEMTRYLAQSARQASRDWANLCRYNAENMSLVAAGRPEVVFLGDSITENWVRAAPKMFGPGRVGRGIGGQTTAQILLRMRADVVGLRPRAVHILAGTNDVGGSAGPTTLTNIQNNIQAMVEIAKANHIAVVLGSVPPASGFPRHPEIAPVDTIRALNRWAKAYAAEAGVIYVDYYSVLATPEGLFRPELTADGVHPTLAGYAAMEPLTRAALAKALRR